MNKGVPDKQGTYLCRIVGDNQDPESIGYKVVYVTENLDILLLWPEGKVTHHLSVDKLEEEL